MGTKSENGINANVMHYAKLHLTIQTYGVRYNPSNKTITLVALSELGEKVNTSLESTNKIHAAYGNAVSERKEAYKPFPGLITQSINAFETCGASEQLIANARSYVHKLRGERITPLYTTEEKAALEAEGKSSTQHSVSQMGFDNMIENFGKMLDIFELVPEYVPNEVELQTPSLRAHYNLLKGKNTAVLAAEVTLKDAYTKRNAVFDDSVTGLVDVATTAKKYVKSVFKADSPEYKSIAGLRFKYIAKK